MIYFYLWRIYMCKKITFPLDMELITSGLNTLQRKVQSTYCLFIYTTMFEKILLCAVVWDIHSFINGSTALCWPWPFIQFRNLFYTDGRIPWTSDQPVARLYTGKHKHRINAHTDIHALSGIRTHDPSFRASEDISCLRPRGHRDRRSRMSSGRKFTFNTPLT
jgi:hypothetical protein